MQTTNVSISASIRPGYDDILTTAALAFVQRLHAEFEPCRQALLRDRAERQARVDAGDALDVLTETISVRESDWTVAPAPADLNDRRVEITGRVDRKMVINASTAAQGSSWPTSRTPTPQPGTTSSRARSTCAMRFAARPRSTTRTDAATN